MKVIGLDFGTTNSILSYYDDEKRIIESHKFGGVDGSNYVPSFLAVDRDDANEIYIGTEAKDSMHDDYHIYSKFKMLLSEDASDKLSKYNYINKHPKEIASEYLKRLITQYKKDNKVNNIDSIVITVPEIWLIDNTGSRKVLMDIIQKENLPLKEFISEPVAAGGYFLYKYEQEHNERFSGHLLIFDYGGGTLDISLLRLEDDGLEVLERTGNGHNIENIGNAGVAFDEITVQTAYEKHFNKKIEKNSKEYHKLLLEFERLKISNSNKIKKEIDRFQKNNIVDKTIFQISDIDIKPSLLVESFKTLKANIISELSKMEKLFNLHNVKIDDRDKFKVVMVGGFSNFYLSQLTVKEFFNSLTDDDIRFHHNLTQEDKALSISKGATLFAKDFIKLKRTYPITISLVYYGTTENGLEEKKWAFMTKGEEVDFDTNYSSLEFSNPGQIKLHFDLGNIQFTEEQEENIVFPNSDLSNNKWIIGFSIDRNNFIYMHIKDKIKSEEITIDFGNLINKHKNKLIAGV